jgi:integrase
VERQRLASKSVTLDRLIEEYTAARSDASSAYRKDLASVSTRLPILGHRVVSTISPSDIDAALRRHTPSMRNSTLSMLKAMLRWGIKRGYLSENPADRVEVSKIKLKDVQIYSPEEVERLLQDALDNDLELLPYRIITIYAGIRPYGEAGRLDWTDINWTEGVVRLRAGQTKRGRPRHPVLQENALAWLHEYRLRGGSTTGKIVSCTQRELQTKLEANYRRSKVKSRKNASRHSYCSYHLAWYGDVNSLVLQSGHAKTQTLWACYYQSATKQDAERFWNILPESGSTANIITVAA